jgi:hypothetical protein
MDNARAQVVAFLSAGGWIPAVILLLAGTWLLGWVGGSEAPPSAPVYSPAYQPPLYEPPALYDPPPVYEPPLYDPSYPDSGFAEDPAPGDDGSLDCGTSGPVYVGSSDPMGLDGDGDGIGCE